MLEKWIKEFKKNKTVYLQIKVFPRSSNTSINEVLDDETIKINIAAPPEKGRANKELINFLARIFSINQKYIKIISGAASNKKLVKIQYGG